MQLMLTKYYAKSQVKQRNSLIDLEDFLQCKRQVKLTKSQSNYNNLTKTSEKSIKSLEKYKKQHQPSFSLKSAPLKLNKHRSRHSYVPQAKIQTIKAKIQTFKPKKAAKREVSPKLSESYDTLLKQFDCTEELKSSLKKLVKLEKLSLKSKFSSKSAFFSKHFPMPSFYESK